MEVLLKKEKCFIEFDHVAEVLVTRRVAMNKNKDLPFGEDPEAFIAEADNIEGFVICGEDEKFVKAKAKITGNKVIVWSEEIPKPVAVRYGWSDFSTCNLYNQQGLPVIPFRTDDFKPPTHFVKPSNQSPKTNN